MASLRIGFIGAGAINFGGAEGPWDHATRLEKMTGLQFVGIADPLTEKAEEVLAVRKASPAGSLYAECRVYPTTAAMLEEARPDAVLVGTPPHVRGELQSGKDLELCLVKAGVHAFVEKPLSAALPEEFNKYVSAMQQAQDENKQIVISVGYMFR